MFATLKQIVIQIKMLDDHGGIFSAVDVIVVQGSYTYKEHQTTPVLSWNMFLFLFSVHRENDIIKGYQFFWQTHWKLENLFFSSIFFSEFIEQLDLNGKTFLDIGCGSGILALSAYKKGARVTALDISSQAVKNTKENFKLNFINIEDEFKVMQSDLFGSLQKQKFDVIAINPPYFFKAPLSEMEYAWNCGENGEYFYELFGELQKFCHKTSNVYMILGENCEIDRITQMAANSNIQLELVDERKIKWERNHIYKLKLSKL